MKSFRSDQRRGGPGHGDDLELAYFSPDARGLLDVATAQLGVALHVAERRGGVAIGEFVDLEPQSHGPSGAAAAVAVRAEQLHRGVLPRRDRDERG
jgi:hypothetical protein